MLLPTWVPFTHARVQNAELVHNQEAAITTAVEAAVSQVRHEMAHGGDGDAETELAEARGEAQRLRGEVAALRRGMDDLHVQLDEANKFASEAEETADVATKASEEVCVGVGVGSHLWVWVCVCLCFVCGTKVALSRVPVFCLL